MFQQKLFFIFILGKLLLFGLTTCSNLIAIQIILIWLKIVATNRQTYVHAYIYTIRAHARTHTKKIYELNLLLQYKKEKNILFHKHFNLKIIFCGSKFHQKFLIDFVQQQIFGSNRKTK